jgi:hypothetical protein
MLNQNNRTGGPGGCALKTFPVSNIAGARFMQSSWDLSQLYWEPPGFRYYFSFLLLIWVVTGLKIIKIWRTLRRAEMQDLQACVARDGELRTSVLSLLRWMGLTLLGWGLFMSVSVGDVSASFLAGSAKGKLPVLMFIRGYAPTLTMALVTAIVLYIVHWWLSKRIEKVAQSGKP